MNACSYILYLDIGWALSCCSSLIVRTMAIFFESFWVCVCVYVWACTELHAIGPKNWRFAYDCGKLASWTDFRPRFIWSSRCASSLSFRCWTTYTYIYVYCHLMETLNWTLILMHWCNGMLHSLKAKEHKQNLEHSAQCMQRSQSWQIW